jgi:hypothetical protein
VIDRRQLSEIAYRMRARLLVLAVLAAYFGGVEALGGRLRGWERLGVPASTLRFADLRNLTSAWDCARRGLAVLPVNPCDPGKRPADFPQLWLLPWHLGLGAGDTVALAFVQAAVFLLAAVLVLPLGASLKAGALFAVVLCSPAVMLGVERENPDLILFPLVLAGVLLVARSRDAAGAAALLAAAILKLYPIFAVAALFRRGTRRGILLGLVVCAAFVVYGLADFSYLHRMLGAIPPSNSFSYGVRRASEWFGITAQGAVGTFGWYRVWDVLLVCAALLAGWLASLRAGAPVTGDAAATRDLDLFWAGASIYVGSYAIFLSNDYRLIFCILTLPQLARWIAERRPLAYVTVAGLLLILWLNDWPTMPGVHVVLDAWNRATASGSGATPLPIVVIAQWVVCVTFVAWLLATQELVRLPGMRTARSLPDAVPA